MRGSQQVEETAADSLVFPHFTFITPPEFVHYCCSLAPCVLNHSVLVLLDRPTPSTLQLVLCIACISYHPKSPPYLGACYLSASPSSSFSLSISHSPRKKPTPAPAANSPSITLESVLTVSVNVVSPRSALNPTVSRSEVVASTHLMTGQ